MARLGPLREFELDHLHVWVPRPLREGVGIEAAVDGSAAEVAGSDLPDQIGAALEVIGADAALAGVVREVAQLGAPAQRQHRVSAERTEAHGRDVQQAGRVRLAAVRPADRHPQVLHREVQRRQRVVDPLVADLVDVLLGAERHRVALARRPLVDQRALIAAERRPLGRALDEVLLDQHVQVFDHEAQMTDDGEVSNNRVGSEEIVAQPQQRQRPQQQQRPQDRRIEDGDDGDGDEDEDGDGDEQNTHGSTP